MGTHISQIRAALEAGETITSLDALKRWGCSRLAAVVHKLIHRDGVPVKSSIIEVQTAGGRIAHVAEYRLERGAA